MSRPAPKASAAAKAAPPSKATAKQSAKPAAKPAMKSSAKSTGSIGPRPAPGPKPASKAAAAAKAPAKPMQSLWSRSLLPAMPNFHDEEIAQMRADFNLLDKDGDGSITREEFDGLAEVFRIPPKFVDLAFVMSDADRSGTINFDEFVQWMHSSKTFDTDQYNFFLRVFNAIDVDKDGKLSLPELQRLCGLIGMERTDAELEKEMKRLDLTGTGKALIFDDFLRWMNIPRPKK